MVFCNTRLRCVPLPRICSSAASGAGLHGDLDQREREEMLVRFANRSCTVLVASDVAARGLDLADLAMVINFDIASDADTHLHRIGRTGRAGRRGIALSLCSPRESTRANVIEDRLGEPLTWGTLPSVSGAERWSAPFVTVAIDAGRQDKLRPGDLLGALTGDAGLPGTVVGKVDVFPTRARRGDRASIVRPGDAAAARRAQPARTSIAAEHRSCQPAFSRPGVAVRWCSPAPGIVAGGDSASVLEQVPVALRRRLQSRGPGREQAENNADQHAVSRCVQVVPSASLAISKLITIADVRPRGDIGGRQGSCGSHSRRRPPGLSAPAQILGNGLLPVPPPSIPAANSHDFD